MVEQANTTITIKRCVFYQELRRKRRRRRRGISRRKEGADDGSTPCFLSSGMSAGWMTGSLISPPALFHLSLPFSPSSSSSHHSVTTGCLASVHLHHRLPHCLTDRQRKLHLKTRAPRTDVEHRMDFKVFLIFNLSVCFQLCR